MAMMSEEQIRSIKEDIGRQGSSIMLESFDVFEILEWILYDKKELPSCIIEVTEIKKYKLSEGQ